MTVHLWFDPLCPWTWITSRWLVEVVGAQGLDVRWRTFSLAEKNAGQEVPEPFRAAVEQARRALRVLEAVRPSGGDDAVGRLYTELGRRFHHGAGDPGDLAGALGAAGLDTGLATAADDEGLDETVRVSMRKALALVGDEVGVPIVGFEEDGELRATSGPILSPAPTGEAAVRLFEAVRTAATTEGFAELKRARRTGGPALPPTP